MADKPRLSRQGLRVLRAFLDNYEASGKDAGLAGADVMRKSALTSGTLYPLLIRFEDAGLLTSEWETQAPEDLGRPRRRIYSLTSTGVELARRELAGLLPSLALRTSEA
jgi:PadR family transcriptional regulator PadR